MRHTFPMSKTRHLPLPPFYPHHHFFPSIPIQLTLCMHIPVIILSLALSLVIFFPFLYMGMRSSGFPRGSTVKNPPAMQETQVQSLGREDPLEKEWQPTPIFLPGEFHGQRILAGYGPQDHKESGTTELTEHTDTDTHTAVEYCVLLYESVIHLTIPVSSFSLSWTK